MKITLPRNEQPMGYRVLRRKAVWFLNAWTTKAEADAVKKRAKDNKKAATIVTKYRAKTGKKYYAVYTSN